MQKSLYLRVHEKICQGSRRGDTGKPSVLTEKDRLAMPVIKERAAPADGSAPAHEDRENGEGEPGSWVVRLCGTAVWTMSDFLCESLDRNHEQTYGVEGSSSIKVKSLGEEYAGLDPFCGLEIG